MQFEAVIKRPQLPKGLRIVRTEFCAMEYLGTPHEQIVWRCKFMVVVGDPHKLTDELKAELKALGWKHFSGRSAGTFQRDATFRFEDKAK